MSSGEKKEKSAVEAEIVGEFKNRKKDHWYAGKIFWGLLFVLVGFLILMDNFGVVDVHWVDLWRLWPLFIISAGLSILAVKNMVWKVLSIVFAVVAVAFIGWVALGNQSGLPALDKDIKIDQDGIHIQINN